MPTLTDYPGSKINIAKRIISMVPPHRVFIEGFAGSAAITQIKRPAAVNLLIEKDPQTIALLRQTFPHAAHVTIDENDESARGLPADLIDKNIYPGQHSPARLSLPAPIAESDHDSGAIAAPVYMIIHADALPVLASYSYTGNEFIYLDPPYLLSTRRSQRPLYRHEMTTEQDHAALLKIARRIPAPVMISGYPSAFYNDSLPGWFNYQYQSMTHAGPATESIWTNYPPPARLHDYRFIGENFTDRQRIKRKAERWVKRFLDTPLIERQAIIAEMTRLKIIE